MKIGQKIFVAGFVNSLSIKASITFPRRYGSTIHARFSIKIKHTAMKIERRNFLNNSDKCNLGLISVYVNCKKQINHGFTDYLFSKKYF